MKNVEEVQKRKEEEEERPPSVASSAEVDMAECEMDVLVQNGSEKRKSNCRVDGFKPPRLLPVAKQRFTRQSLKQNHKIHLNSHKSHRLTNHSETSYTHSLRTRPLVSDAAGGNKLRSQWCYKSACMYTHTYPPPPPVADCIVLTSLTLRMYVCMYGFTFVVLWPFKLIEKSQNENLIMIKTAGPSSIMVLHALDVETSLYDNYPTYKYVKYIAILCMQLNTAVYNCYAYITYLYKFIDYVNYNIM